MTISANNNAVDIKALVYALTKQRESLPQPIQSSLQKIGRDFQQNQPTAADELRKCIKSYQPLDVAYRDAILELDSQYHSQERTKSLSATLAESPSVSWFFVHEVIPAADWVTTVKQAINPPMQGEAPLSDKITRIGIYMVGGIGLGTWTAQETGAIIGGILALSFGLWYEYSNKKTARETLSSRPK